MGVQIPKIQSYVCVKKIRKYRKMMFSQSLIVFIEFIYIKDQLKTATGHLGGYILSSRIFLTETYFFQKSACFQFFFELFDSGLIFGHLPYFLEFGEENKLALKFNFTY